MVSVLVGLLASLVDPSGAEAWPAGGPASGPARFTSCRVLGGLDLGIKCEGFWRLGAWM